MPDALAPDPDASPVTIDWSEPAYLITLVREPRSDAARAFTVTVAGLIQPFLDRKRPIGAKGLPTHHATTGSVLAGLLKAGLKGRAVRAQSGKAGGQWKGGAPLGHKAFWQYAKALERAGLIGSKLGAAFWRYGERDGVATGLWCKRPMLRLASDHGLTADSYSVDWPLSWQAQSVRPSITEDELILCCEIPPEGSDARNPCPIAADQAALAAEYQDQILRLNAHLATATVLGCTPPVLRRRFFADMRLGGRLVAIGPEPFQSLRRSERQGLTINGDPIAEVDIVASAISIFLAFIGTTIPIDPYQHGPLVQFDRDAAKQWVNQSLHQGRPALGWGKKTSSAVRQHKIRPIKQAALLAYPALAEPIAALPDEIRDRAPFDRVAWVTGQWIAGLEARIMGDALERLMDQGVIALPLHDAVLVPEGAVELAVAALEGAFEALLGVRPRVRVKRPEIRLLEAPPAGYDGRRVEDSREACGAL